MERRLDDAVTFPDCNCGGDNRDRLSSPAEAAHPGQHGTTDGHLVGTGEWGKITHLGDVRVHDAEEGLIADVAVDRDGNYAHLARWGGSDGAGPKAGGQTTPDGGLPHRYCRPGQPGRSRVNRHHHLTFIAAVRVRRPRGLTSWGVETFVGDGQNHHPGQRQGLRLTDLRRSMSHPNKPFECPSPRGSLGPVRLRLWTGPSATCRARPAQAAAGLAPRLRTRRVDCHHCTTRTPANLGGGRSWFHPEIAAFRVDGRDRPVIALQFDRYGDPDVLTVGEAPQPQAGPGQVRIAVRACSVNSFDWKLRAGYLDGMVPIHFPAIPGVDAAGVVDQVGPGVQGIAVGDEVFGIGTGTAAASAVLDMFAKKPASIPFVEAAGLGLAVETAARALDMLDIRPGGTVLIDGAAGGVGSAATQLAVARGAWVIGTASEGNHDYLTSLGATPTRYGPGLVGRVTALAPDGVDAALDTAGKGSVAELISLVPTPSKVVTIADYEAPKLGARLADGSTDRAEYALADVATLAEEGTFITTIDRVFPLAEGAEAHRLSQRGHVRGKVILTVP